MARPKVHKAPPEDNTKVTKTFVSFLIGNTEFRSTYFTDVGAESILKWARKKNATNIKKTKKVIRYKAEKKPEDTTLSPTKAMWAKGP